MAKRKGLDEISNDLESNSNILSELDINSDNIVTQVSAENAMARRQTEKKKYILVKLKKDILHVGAGELFTNGRINENLVSKFVLHKEGEHPVVMHEHLINQYNAHVYNTFLVYLDVDVAKKALTINNNI